MTVRSGVLFDIDGTLVDTNYLHVLAWRRAFLEAGFDVAAAAVHRCVGMGSTQLMAELLGEARDDVKQSWRRHFEQLKPEVRAFPGAQELLRTVAARGVQVVLASSSEQEDVDLLVESVGAVDVIGSVTSAGDVGQAKPEPDVFQVAMDKAGCDATTAIVVGDTVWDVQAAARCGLRCVCVVTGGISRQELEAAGAVAVYRDVAELLERLDESPLGRLGGT